MMCPIQSRDNAAVLLDYCDRRLDPDTMDRLSRHVEQCQECRETLAGQRLVWEALDAWEAAPVSMDFNRRLYRRIESEQAAGWWSHLFRPAMPWSMRPALPVAAACMALMAMFLLRAPSDVQGQQQMSTEAIDLEQVEKTLDDLEMLRQLGVALPEPPAAPQSL
jgi:anti-sigma factor RsiW